MTTIKPAISALESLSTQSQSTEIGERSAEHLIDKCVPYSEMTEEEIMRVVAFKANAIANEEKYIKQQEEFNAQMQQIIDNQKEIAQQSHERFQALVDKALSQQVVIPELEIKQEEANEQEQGK